MQSEAIDKLATALAKAQGAIRGAEKDRENPHFKSQYSTLDAVWKACRVPLAENGLSVVQVVEQREGKHYLVSRLLHASGQAIDSALPWCPPGGEAAQAQALGSYLTYLRRYGLSALVGVAPTDDDDGEGAMKGHDDRDRYEQRPPADDREPDHREPTAEDEFQWARDRIMGFERSDALFAWAKDKAEQIQSLGPDLESRIRKVYAERLAALKKAEAPAAPPSERLLVTGGRDQTPTPEMMAQVYGAPPPGGTTDEVANDCPPSAADLSAAISRLKAASGNAHPDYVISALGGVPGPGATIQGQWVRDLVAQKPDDAVKLWRKIQADLAFPREGAA